MELSARTMNYVEALVREGDKFDHQKWLRESRVLAQADNLPSVAIRFRAISSNGVRWRSQHASSGFLQLNNNVGGRLQSPRYHIPLTAKSACLGDELNKLCHAWSAVQTSRRRDAIYGYLTTVFVLVRKYRARGQLNELICHAQQKLRVTTTDGVEPYAAIIRATTNRNIDRQTISKYSRALRYARRYGNGRPIGKLHQGPRRNKCLCRIIFETVFVERRTAASS